MIEVNGLTKFYGDNCAVDHLTFRIANGHIFGLLGRNGAGKSTTMNMLTGCLLPTSGTVRINGFDMAERPKEAKKCICGDRDRAYGNPNGSFELIGKL